MVAKWCSLSACILEHSYLHNGYGFHHRNYTILMYNLVELEYILNQIEPRLVLGVGQAHVN